MRSELTNSFLKGAVHLKQFSNKVVQVVAEEELKHRLEGPADTGCAGISHEQCAQVDGMMVEEVPDVAEAPAMVHRTSMLHCLMKNFQNMQCQP